MYAVQRNASTPCITRYNTIQKSTYSCYYASGNWKDKNIDDAITLESDNTVILQAFVLFRNMTEVCIMSIDPEIPSQQERNKNNNSSNNSNSPNQSSSSSSKVQVLSKNSIKNQDNSSILTTGTASVSTGTSTNSNPCSTKVCYSKTRATAMNNTQSSVNNDNINNSSSVSKVPTSTTSTSSGPISSMATKIQFTLASNNKKSKKRKGFGSFGSSGSVGSTSNTGDTDTLNHNNSHTNANGIANASGSSSSGSSDPQQSKSSDESQEDLKLELESPLPNSHPHSQQLVKKKKNCFRNVFEEEEDDTTTDTDCGNDNHNRGKLMNDIHSDNSDLAGTHVASGDKMMDSNKLFLDNLHLTNDRPSPSSDSANREGHASTTTINNTNTDTTPSQNYHASPILYTGSESSGLLSISYSDSADSSSMGSCDDEDMTVSVSSSGVDPDSSGTNNNSSAPTSFENHSTNPTNSSTSSSSSWSPSSSSSSNDDVVMDSNSMNQENQTSQQQQRSNTPIIPQQQQQGTQQSSRWRVKLYRLNMDGSWDDCGTGQICLLRKNTGSATTANKKIKQEMEKKEPQDPTKQKRQIERQEQGHQEETELQRKEQQYKKIEEEIYHILGDPTLFMHAEIPNDNNTNNSNSSCMAPNATQNLNNKPKSKVLLRTRVLLQDSYQRQGENIITWCEPYFVSGGGNPQSSNFENQPNTQQAQQEGSVYNNRESEDRQQQLTGVDLALSFQDNAGCLDIWNKISNMQVKAYEFFQSRNNSASSLPPVVGHGLSTFSSSQSSLIEGQTRASIEDHKVQIQQQQQQQQQQLQHDENMSSSGNNHQISAATTIDDERMHILQNTNGSSPPPDKVQGDSSNTSAWMTANNNNEIRRKVEEENSGIGVMNYDVDENNHNQQKYIEEAKAAAVSVAAQYVGTGNLNHDNNQDKLQEHSKHTMQQLVDSESGNTLPSPPKFGNLEEIADIIAAAQVSLLSFNFYVHFFVHHSR